jgi:hypothetical protein
MVRKQVIGVREALEYIEAKRWQIFPNNGNISDIANRVP